ncbi:MAG TPA: hypothetical protein VFI42_00630 [Thermomicrobiaceae bacterium]|nr:hypothetical protein [Thermomicrobiaceae bacterium]
MTLAARRPRLIDHTAPPETTEPIELVETLEPGAPARPRRARRGYLMLNGAALVALAALFLGCIGILYLIQTSQVAQLGYQMSHLQTRYDELTDANEKLRYQIDRDHSLPVVQQVAITKLEMVPLHTFKFLQVQRPAQDQLPAPAPEPRTHLSLWRQVREALLGTSRADHATNPPSAPPAGARP